MKRLKVVHTHLYPIGYSFFQTDPITRPIMTHELKDALAYECIGGSSVTVTGT